MNIANYLNNAPADKPALIIDDITTTFGDLSARSDFLAWGLQAKGVKPGMKAIFVVSEPTPDMLALYFAMLKTGVAPIFLPNEMDWATKLPCILQCGPKIFVGTPKSYMLKVFFARPFSTIDINIMLGRFQLFGGIPISKLSGKNEAFPLHDATSTETASIFFTSGSTDYAKGVIYTNEMLDAQLKLFNKILSSDTSTLFTTIPQYALLGILSGKTVAIHGENETPSELANAIATSKADTAICTATQWDAMAYAQPTPLLSDIKQAIILSNAPHAYLHNALLNGVLPSTAETYSIYNCAESFAITTISGSDFLAQFNSPANTEKGFCLGKADFSSEIVIAEPQQDGIGEICVSSPQTANSYCNRPDETEAAKYIQNDKQYFRTGDLGYVDKDGFLWYCGRKSRAFNSLYPARCESVFAHMPGIKRSALVNVCDVPVMVLEPEPSAYDKLADSQDIAQQHAVQFPATSTIRHILFHHNMPKDYNALTQWATERI